MNRPYINFILICVYLWYKPTRGPLVLYRSPECWGYAELEQTWKYMSTQSFISCHPYRSIRKQIYPRHKNGQGQPRVIIWTKAQGMGIQPLGKSSGSILKLLLFPSFCISSRKIRFASLFYMVFCFISYMCTVYLALGQDDTTLGDNFVDGSRKVYHFDHWLHVSKISYALWFYAHFFMTFYMYVASGRGQTTH